MVTIHFHAYPNKLTTKVGPGLNSFTLDLITDDDSIVVFASADQLEQIGHCCLNALRSDAEKEMKNETH